MSASLGKFRLLEDFAPAQRERLGEFMQETFAKQGASVFGYGREASTMVFVASGAIRLEHEGESLGEVGPGEVLGGASLVGIGSRECDAFAVGETRVFLLTREHYLRLRSEEPELALLLQEATLRSLGNAVRATLRANAAS